MRAGTSGLLCPPRAGKYAIAYNFALKPGSVLEKLLSITPSGGSIEPGKDVRIELAWNKDKSLR